MKKEYSEARNEIQTLINKQKFCWVCGRDNILTEHHVIPQRLLSVKLNVTIPICQNCKELLHANDVIAALIKRIFFK